MQPLTLAIAVTGCRRDERCDRAVDDVRQPVG